MSSYVMVDGVRLPVAGIALTGGKIVLTCTARGPLEAKDGGAVTVFGEDGMGVAQGYSRISWPEVSARDALTVHISLAWESCFGDAERVPA